MDKKGRKARLNTVQYAGMNKYNLSNIPPKLRRTHNTIAVSNTKHFERKLNIGSADDHDGSIHDFQKTESTSSCQYSIPVVDDFHMYTLAVIQEQYFCPCNSDFTAFAIADFDAISKKIMKQRIHVVMRKTISFQGQFVWVYYCTCNPVYASYIETLSNNLGIHVNDFKTQECNHVRVTKHLLADLDVVWGVSPDLLYSEHSYGMKNNDRVNVYLQTVEFLLLLLLAGLITLIFVTMDTEMWELDFGNTYVAVLQPSPGVVSVVQKKLYCLTCVSHYCKHCKVIKNKLEISDTEDFPDIIYRIASLVSKPEESSSRSYVYEAISKEKISFRLDQTLRESFLYKDREFDKQDEVIQMFPDETQPTCQCGNAWETTYFVQAEHDIPLVYKYDVKRVKVHGRKCTVCEHELRFDGGRQAILNMQSFMIHHSILRDYMWHFLYARCTLYSYYNVWMEQMKDMGIHDFSKTLSYTKFRHSWYAFLDLLDIDFDVGFECTECLKQPDVIICDATSLAFRKSFVPWKSLATDEEPLPFNGRFKDRVLIPDKKTRDLIQKYCTHGCQIENDDFEIMCKSVLKHLPCCSDLLKMLRDTGCTQSCPNEHKPLVKLLGSSSPACALIASSITNAEIIEGFTNIPDEISNHPELLKSLQDNIPLIFDIVKCVDKLPLCYKKVISGIYEKSKSTFSDGMSNPEDKSINEDLNAFFPALNMVRRRGCFRADKTKDDKKTCKKDSTRHPTLLPGIFTAFCKHGICYGFQIMESNESPNTPFTFLRSRFEKEILSFSKELCLWWTIYTGVIIKAVRRFTMQLDTQDSKE